MNKILRTAIYGIAAVIGVAVAATFGTTTITVLSTWSGGPPGYSPPPGFEPPQPSYTITAPAPEFTVFVGAVCAVLIAHLVIEIWRQWPSRAPASQGREKAPGIVG
jgi:hypothetical protein